MAAVLKGVLFDMDGLMIDTEKLLVRFWCESARSFGFPAVRAHRIEIMNAYIDEHGIEVKPAAWRYRRKGLEMRRLHRHRPRTDGAVSQKHRRL